MSKISKERIAHMHTVAELMYENAPSIDNKYLTREQIYHLGLVHDIGYLQGKDNHEENGAEILNGDNMIQHCIKWHGSSPLDYMCYNCCSDNEIPHELILLWWADLMVESTGEDAGIVVGFKKRLEGIKNRLGKDSAAYRICTETAAWLIKNTIFSGECN